MEKLIASLESLGKEMENLRTKCLFDDEFTDIDKHPSLEASHLFCAALAHLELAHRNFAMAAIKLK